MWFVVGRDEKVCFIEGEESESARAAFRNRWLGVLPQVCFAEKHAREAEEERRMESQGGRRWVSWSL
jgi:hypothetical protein